MLFLHTLLWILIHRQLNDKTENILCLDPAL
jgi:hypothetical protein